MSLFLTEISFTTYKSKISYLSLFPVAPPAFESQSDREGPQFKQKAVTAAEEKESSQQPRRVESHGWRDGLKNTALLIICYDRDDYLTRTLEGIAKFHPGGGLVPVIISEDGKHGNMAKVTENFRKVMKEKDQASVVLHINHEQKLSAENGYFLLADHYKWALDQVPLVVAVL
jgi:hypothetical protein